jgi:hypothetical protein
VRLLSGASVKLHPRNFRSCGRATALFVSFTLSRVVAELIHQGAGHRSERLQMLTRRGEHINLAAVFRGEQQVAVVADGGAQLVAIALRSIAKEEHIGVRVGPRPSNTALRHYRKRLPS